MPDAPPDSLFPVQTSCCNVIFLSHCEYLVPAYSNTVYPDDEEPELFRVRALSCVHLPTAGPLCTGASAVTFWRRRREKACFTVSCVVRFSPREVGQSLRMCQETFKPPPLYVCACVCGRVCACVYKQLLIMQLWIYL